MELYQAHQQWSNRPKDENYPTIQAMYEATTLYKAQAFERPTVPLDSLRAVADNGDVQLVGKGNIPARIGHWAFGQVAKYAGAPADYLRSLPATLATQNINHGLAQRAKDTTVNLLFHRLASSEFLVRAFTSERYSRVWNCEVAERLLQFADSGWQAATPTYNQRIGGDKAGLTGLWASDHDMFAFILHPDRVVKEPGTDKGLLRGLIAVNSEVGAAKLRLMRFLFREMCGNHIVWGAENVVEVSARHIGHVRDSLGLWSVEARRYLDETASADEARIERAKSKLIAATKDQVLDAMFGKRPLLLSRKLLTAGYDAVNPEQDGDPRTYWGLAQGITRFSQSIPYADERLMVDRAAGRIIDMVA